MNLAYIVRTRLMYATVKLSMVLFHMNYCFFSIKIVWIFYLRGGIVTMARTAKSKTIKAKHAMNIGILKFSRMLPVFRPDISLALVI